MAVASRIRDVFDHFQNLNLIVLIQDLRVGRVAHEAWLAHRQLCPVAHGLPTGQLVESLRINEQKADLGDSCRFAARHMGADPHAIIRFVEDWDDTVITSQYLLEQLDELWLERMEDAELVQEIIREVPAEVN